MVNFVIYERKYDDISAIFATINQGVNTEGRINLYGTAFKKKHEDTCIFWDGVAANLQPW